MSLYISENADKDSKANTVIFKEFIQRLRAIIDNQGSRHRELSVAIKGYGYFAAVCTLYFDPLTEHRNRGQSLCVCVCVCIYMCMYVWESIYMCVCVCVHLYVCIDTHTPGV